MRDQGNYELAKIKARPVFLKKNQNEIIEKYNLKHDEAYLYMTFLYQDYRIGRLDAAVEKKEDDASWKDCSHEEVLSVYDLLGYSEKKPHIAEEWCIVNSLPGVAHTSGLGDSFFKKYDKVFMQDEDAFLAACEKLGGEQVPYGDVGFRFRIFDELPILMRIYRADDEFDAQITLLWDKNALDFVHYETTYYIAGVLFEKICKLAESRK
jgi:hypothetical protein